VGYPGGKGGDGVYQRIINLMPPHPVYIEPFLGGGAVMRLKRPAALNIGLDRDAAAIARFGDSAGSIAGNGVGSDRAAFRFLCADAFAFLRSYRFTGEELVYCDPPYMHSTRGRRNVYRFEMTDAQHRKLLRTLLKLPCRVMVSGYWTQLYARELAGWRSIHFEAMTRGGHTATEWLWFNFEEPLALHDYRYLGEGFRQRERIARRKRRWVSRLKAMPVLERRALLSAIGEAWDPASPEIA
jgi:hypothetical protein